MLLLVSSKRIALIGLASRSSAARSNHWTATSMVSGLSAARQARDSAPR